MRLDWSPANPAQVLETVEDDLCAANFQDHALRLLCVTL